MATSRVFLNFDRPPTEEEMLAIVEDNVVNGDGSPIDFNNLTSGKVGKSNGLPVVSKDFMNGLVADLLAANKQSRAALDRNATDQLDLEAMYKTLTESVAGGKIKEGDATAKTWLLKGQIETQDGIASARRLSELGLNEDDARNLGAALSVHMRDSAAQRLALRDQINQKKSVNFLDSPLEYIINNAIDLPRLIQSHNDLVDTVDSDASTISALTKSADALHTGNQAKNGILKGSLAVATAEQVQASAAVAANQVRLEAVKVNSSFADQRLTRGLAYEGVLSRTLAALESANRIEDTAHTKEVKSDLEKATLDNINVSAAIIGVPAFTSLMEYNKAPKKLRDALETVKLSGGSNFGDTPLDALATVSVGDRRQLPKDQQTLIRTTEALSTAIRDGITPAEKSVYSTPAKMREYINAKLPSVYKDLQSKTEQDVDGGNPYRAPPIETMLTDPEFGQTKLAGLIKATQASAPAVKIDDKFVVSLATQDFVAGSSYKKVEDAAKDLESYFTRAMAINNAAYKWDAWNLPKQERYGLSVSVGPNSTERYDFAKNTNIMKYLISAAYKTVIAQPEYAPVGILGRPLTQ